MPNTSAHAEAQDPFIEGRTQGAIRLVDDLAGCLMADASNGFNNLSRLDMLCTVEHRWPAASIFAFNCYRHFLHLIIWVPGD